MQQKNKINLYRMTVCGMMAALSVVLVILVHFPIIPAAPYLEYDAADIPVLITAFAVGPISGMAVLFVVSLVQAFLLGGNGIIGFVMHFAASGFLVLISSLIYRRKKNLSSLIIGLALGSLVMTAAMIPLNIIFTPILFSTPVEAVVKLVIPVLIPFNLIKSVANSVISFAVYSAVKRPISAFVKRYLPENEDRHSGV